MEIDMGKYREGYSSNSDPVMYHLLGVVSHSGSQAGISEDINKNNHLHYNIFLYYIHKYRFFLVVCL
tara:strand:- start:433 stop:633 length:201 start_codon:yes stop_codon:yes gene_type:complete